ncbi:septal ring lytic transglycosylase RlpA family protein [Occallatibacter savannae]|uniref:septal ring lytic transglycosylase RlpA family protein n=1 Tax=Occallatibacter savannae TaxID=1002691 RepID=UPI0019514D27|nr:septal ring lytic transglycosylase RlpA family protein [Occallatibacter savannae]
MIPKKPLPLWLLIGTSCVALAGMLCTLPARTVQADAGVPRPAAATSPAVVANATPQMSAPAPKPHSKLLKGIASWYGDQFDGKKTASGEEFSQDEMTACHPTLPFGSEVRVVNLRNHKSVVVRITDRAELVKGRVIDLSHAAAEKLSMTKAGVARVSIEVLSIGHPGV